MNSTFMFVTSDINTQKYQLLFTELTLVSINTTVHHSCYQYVILLSLYFI